MAQRQPTRTKRHPRAAALAIVMLVVFLLSAASVVTLGLARNARLRTARNIAGTVARCAADSGAERLLYQINQNLKNGTFSAVNLPAYANESMVNANAVYSASMAGNTATGYDITSTGTVGSVSRTIRVHATLESPFADFAVYTRSTLDIKNSGLIDGYNSLDLSDKTAWPAVGTQSTQKSAIAFKKDANVKGDVYLMPDANPGNVISGAEAVKGQIYTQAKPFDFSPVPQKAFLGSKGKLQGKNITINAAGSGNYTGIDISNSGSLTINGDCVLVVKGNVKLGNSAKIDIAPNSSLTMYLEGDFDGKNGGGVNNQTKFPSNFQLLGGSANQNIDMKNGSDFYGVIYAPNANTVFHNGTDIYGSVMVNSLEIKNSGAIHYDKALQKATPQDLGVRFVVTRWEEL